MSETLRNALRDRSLPIDFSDNRPWPRFSDEERINVLRKCGTRCFALPPDPALHIEEVIASPKKHLKYPVCRPPRSSRECKASASGLLAATRRARLTKTVQLVKKLEQILAETTVLKKDYVIKSARLLPSIDGKFPVRIVYTNKIVEELKPLTARGILNKYREFLSKSDLKRLGA